LFYNMEIVTIIALLIIIIAEKYFHTVERKEMIDSFSEDRVAMLDRIMAKDLPEFKERTEKLEDNKFDFEDPDVVELSEINNEDKEILNG